MTKKTPPVRCGGAPDQVNDKGYTDRGAPRLGLEIFRVQHFIRRLTA
ncbi:MAG TPA: hypothetical protein VMJ30_06150 [Gemmatimonadales bacterium]|nr:hypothetical protein [Gemmatimonadales bacterium]